MPVSIGLSIPINRLTCINHGQATKDLDLSNLANVCGPISSQQYALRVSLRNARNLRHVKDIHGVIVARISREVVRDGGVLPGLRDGTVVEGVRLVRPDAVDEPGHLFLVVVDDGVC